MIAERAPALPSYTIRRSTRARRSRLTVTEQGQAVVVLPLRASEREAGDLVARHQRWIARHVERIAARRTAIAARLGLGAGREILFGGVAHRVVDITSLDGRSRSSVELHPGTIVVRRSSAEKRSTAQVLEAWLRGQARRAIEARVSARSAEMGIAVGSISIRDQRTRWGSASRRGHLSFSWRLLMCPPQILDYVVVHEIAHLRAAGHTKAFWRLVARYFPDTAGARRWLREHHDEIQHALD